MKNSLLIAFALTLTSTAFADSLRWDEVCSFSRNKTVTQFKRYAVESGGIQLVKVNGQEIEGDGAYLNMAESDYETTPAGTLINMTSKKEVTLKQDVKHDEEGYTTSVVKFTRKVRVDSINKELVNNTGILKGEIIILQCVATAMYPSAE